MVNFSRYLLRSEFNLIFGGPFHIFYIVHQKSLELEGLGNLHPPYFLPQCMAGKWALEPHLCDLVNYSLNCNIFCTYFVIVLCNL